MQYKKIDKNTYVIRIIRGEKIVEILRLFCQKNKIQGGFFYGLGAVDAIELAHYDVSSKKYSSIKFEKPYEMTNIVGSIGVIPAQNQPKRLVVERQEELIIHAHATFSDKKMQTIGGHLVDATISGTAEIYLIQLPQLTKSFDHDTGLKLFDLV